MKVILQTRELPRGHFQDTVWSLCSFQAIRRQSLNLVGVAGGVCWETSTEGGRAGLAGFRACRLTMNRPLWGM